jgi:hypothetical protein
MAIEITDAPASSDLKMLGSGSGLVSSGNGWVAVDSFVRPKITVGDSLIIRVDTRMQVDSLENHGFGVSNVSGDQFMDNQNPCFYEGAQQHCWSECTCFRSPVSTANYNIINNNMNVQFMVTDAGGKIGNLDNAVTLYINVEKASLTAQNYAWAAYVIKANAK